jgi:hypothetical protein
MLKVFYSSGSITTNVFPKIPGKSIGGVVSDTEVSKGLGRLFGTIAMDDFANGSKDYRCVFLKNIDISREIQELSVYVDVLLDTLPENFDPQTLTPILGDSYIVPKNSVNQWFGYDGKIATWDGTAWIFEFNYFAKFLFGTEPADDYVQDGVTYQKSVVQVLNDVYDPPYGLDFVSANGSLDKLLLGNINAGSQVVLWIQRIVDKYVFKLIDFDIANIDYDQGGFVLPEGQKIRFVFDYVLKNSFLLTATDEFRIAQSVSQNFIVSLVNDLTGEEGYTNLRVNVEVFRNNVKMNDGTVLGGSFLAQSYTNIQNTGYIGNVLGFASSLIPADLNLSVIFSAKAVYDLVFSLVDLSNSGNILTTKSVRFIVS